MSKDKEIKVRLPKTVKDRLQAEAAVMETNSSHIVRIAISHYFQNRAASLSS